MHIRPLIRSIGIAGILCAANAGAEGLPGLKGLPSSPPYHYPGCSNEEGALYWHGPSSNVQFRTPVFGFISDEVGKPDKFGFSIVVRNTSRDKSVRFSSHMASTWRKLLKPGEEVTLNVGVRVKEGEETPPVDISVFCE